MLMLQGRGILRDRRWQIACICPVVMLAAWQLYCLAAGLGSVHINRLVSGNPVWTEVLWAWEWIVKTLLIRPFSRSGGWDGMLPPAGLSAILWVALLCMLLFRRVKKPLRARCMLFAGGAFVLYTLFLLASAATVFSPEISRWQARPQRLTELMDRYFIPYFYGMACWAAALLEDAAWPQQRVVRRLAAVGTCVGLALMVNWQNLACLLPGGFAMRFPTDNGSAWMREHLTWFQQIEDPDDTRVILIPGGVSSLRYALVPVSLVEAGGLPEGEDAASALWELADRTAANHLVVTQPESAERLSQACGQELQTDVLYGIKRTQNAVTLVKAPF